MCKACIKEGGTAKDVIALVSHVVDCEAPCYSEKLIKWSEFEMLYDVKTLFCKLGIFDIKVIGYWHILNILRYTSMKKCQLLIFKVTLIEKVKRKRARASVILCDQEQRPGPQNSGLKLI